MKHARCVLSRASRVPVGHRELSNQLPDTISLHSQDCSQLAKSFISSSNEVGLGRLLDETGRPDKSCFLAVDVRQPDTCVARSDTVSRKFQTSSSLPDLSLDNGHVDTDNGHVAHTESLLPRLNKSAELLTTLLVEISDVISSTVAAMHTACKFIRASLRRSAR